jgi:hypothetical protein
MHGFPIRHATSITQPVSPPVLSARIQINRHYAKPERRHSCRSGEARSASPLCLSNRRRFASPQRSGDRRSSSRLRNIRD